MEQSTFVYQYSSGRNREVEAIRNKYLPKTESEIDTLKRLDAEVKRPANMFAYVFGSISAIIMGSGMSLVMTDIGSSVGWENAIMPGIIIGIVGMAMALVNYPMYKAILGARKKKYGAKIIELSDKIINN